MIPQPEECISPNQKAAPSGAAFAVYRRSDLQVILHQHLQQLVPVHLADQGPGAVVVVI